MNNINNDNYSYSNDGNNNNIMIAGYINKIKNKIEDNINNINNINN